MATPIPTPAMREADYEKSLYYGPAMAQLRILKQQMQLGGLKIGTRTVEIAKDVFCVCNICFNDEEVRIYLNEKSDCVYGGFLFHPRVGPIDTKIYIYQLGDGLASAHINFVAGTGFYPDGTILPGSPVEYPMIDNDKGTRKLEQINDVWQLESNPEENYGNIDWKGKKTLSTDGTYTAPVITWKGPTSRYFAEAMVSHVTNQLYYDRFIYKDGCVCGELPIAETPSATLGEPVPLYVLGACITKDSTGKEWKVCVAKEYYYDPFTGDNRSFFKVLAQESKDLSVVWWNGTTRVTGWRVLRDFGGLSWSCPFHFNASGTEASSVINGTIHTLSIDINNFTVALNSSTANTIGTATSTNLGSVAGPYNGWDGSVTSTTGAPLDPNTGIWIQPDNRYVGSCTYSSGNAGSFSENTLGVIAVDYIDDVRVEAKLQNISSANDENSIRSLISATSGLYPGHPSPERASYSNKTLSGIFRNGDRKITLSILGKSITIYSDENSQDYRTSYEVSSSIGYYVGNDGVTTSLNSLQKAQTIEESHVYAGVISFMDLRHSIVVVATRETYSKYTAFTNQFVGTLDGTEAIPPEYITDGFTKTYYKVHNSVMETVTLPAFDGLVVTDNDLALTTPSPWASTGGVTSTWNVYDIHFRYSNQPIGSWAVGTNEEHFYSMLTKDGGWTFLKPNADIRTLTNIQGDNLVCFPIAPI